MKRSIAKKVPPRYGSAGVKDVRSFEAEESDDSREVVREKKIPGLAHLSGEIRALRRPPKPLLRLIAPAREFIETSMIEV